MGSPRFDDRHAVIGMYLADNLRAFRTWGVSATSPWEYGHFWSLRDGVDQPPPRAGRGLGPTSSGRASARTTSIERYERMDVAFGRSDWVPTADGQALLRNNRPLLAYIAGKPDRFTSKDHNFRPGETVEKQIIVLNNSRADRSRATCEWELGVVAEVSEGTSRCRRASKSAFRSSCSSPASLAAGKYELECDSQVQHG